MRTIEFQSHTNSIGNLEINYPIKEKNKNVRVVIFIDEEINNDEKLWLKSINSNPAFAFLKDEEDIYTLNDGKAVELKN